MLRDFLDHLGRKAERGFVEQQNLRICHQRPADREHLLLAARERPGGLAKALVQSRKQTEDAFAPPRKLGRVVQQIGAKLQVFRNRHRREDAAALRHQHHAARRAGIRRGPGRGTPRNVTSPELATRPMIARISVLLPAPFGPRMATNSPSATERLTWCSASARP